MMSLRIGVLVFPFLLACVKNADNKPLPRDSGGFADIGWDIPKGDALALAFVSVDYPDHLVSNVSADTQISLTVGGPKSNTSSLFLQSTVIRSGASKAPLKGKWTFYGGFSGDYTAYFTPDAPLAEGEYEISVDPSKGVKLFFNGHFTIKPSLFHVGSHPRVVAVEFRASKGKPNPIDTVLPGFSEPMVLDDLASHLVIEKRSSNQWVQASFSSGTTLATPLSMTDEIRVTVKKEIKAATGKTLDGLYSGSPGSGDFVAAFNMKDIDQGSMIWYATGP